MAAVGNGLRHIALSPEYRSGDAALSVRFFEPCLEVSARYSRAVGYFTSAGLSVVARGLDAFISAGGVMRLVASPLFEEDDLNAIRRGTVAQSDAVERALLRQLIQESDDPVLRDRFGYLAWLLSEGQLEMRFAIPIDSLGAPKRGIYHEKIGIFEDNDGNGVAFTGSPNETAGGLVENFESIDVYWSWDDPHSRVARKIEHFEDLWSGRISGLRIIDCPSAIRDSVLQYRPNSRPRYARPEADAVQVPSGQVCVFGDKLWSHQKEALASFLEAKNGVLEMATGTGKTRTALAICEALLSDESINTVIVTADGNDLLDQWSIDVLKLGQTSRTTLAVFKNYEKHKELDGFLLGPENAVLLTSRQNLPKALRYLSGPQKAQTILIHDEIHRLGSPANIEGLRGLAVEIPYRLGLSATPEREYDDIGNAFILDEIGPAIFRYPLELAIQDRVLSPFQYYPLDYFPDEDDRSSISRVYKQVAARRREGNPMSKAEIWTAIARVYKTSLAKIPVFMEFIDARPDLLDRCIIFVETMEYGQRVLEIVHEIKPDFHTYFSGEAKDVLRRFAAGDLECLVTCHRLSEGIDIRSLKNVILFSSSRARLETIQRMGRCLRVDPDDRDKVANVVDFVRADQVDNGDAVTPTDIARKEWLENLARFRPQGGL